MTNLTDIEHNVATHFAHDVAEHRMTVQLDHGLHRHLVFQRREHSWNCRFELITAPGSLTITGDHGAHTFRRLADMFQFFRRNGNNHGINPGYWAEKLPDAGRSVKVHSEELLDQHLKEMLRDLAEDYRRDLAAWRADAGRYGEDAAGDKPVMPDVLRRARELVSDARFDGILGYRENADVLLGELQNIGAVADVWEWELRDWDFHFLWNLHAIAWGVAQYDDAVKAGLHKIRRGCMPWDTPLPTTAPPAPKPRKAPAAKTETLVSAGGVL
jgi:hypothetical protein